MNLATLSDRCVAAYGDYDFLIFEETHYTSQMMVRLSQQMANVMQGLGIERGDRVVVLLQNCPEVLISYLGLQRLGSIVVPVMYSIGPTELSHILQNSEAVAIITSESLLPLVQQTSQHAPALQQIILIDAHLPNTHYLPPLLKTASPEFKTVETADDDVAVLLYTSGTTGVPKGVMLTHQNLYSNADVTSQMNPIPRPIGLGFLPLSHSYGFTVMNASFLTGATIVLMRQYKTETAFHLIEKYKINSISAVPTVINLMLNSAEADQYDLSSLARVGSGSAPLPVEVLIAFRDKFGCEVREGYGLSEAAPVVSTHWPDRPIKPGSVGQPIPGVSVRIVDEAGVDVSPGQVGELITQGPNVMKGYYKMPAQTAETVRDGWLYTGDMARQDADGYLYIVERKKDLIIRGGFNVYPRDVEEILIQHPAVLEVAVIGVPDPIMGEEIAAIVVLHPDASATAAALISHCEAHLAKSKSPRHIHFVTQLPKSAIGKVLRKELRVQYGVRHI